MLPTLLQTSGPVINSNKIPTLSGISGSFTQLFSRLGKWITGSTASNRCFFFFSKYNFKYNLPVLLHLPNLPKRQLHLSLALLSTGSGRHSDAVHEIRLIGCCILLNVVPKTVSLSGSSRSPLDCLSPFGRLASLEAMRLFLFWWTIILHFVILGLCYW